MVPNRTKHLICSKLETKAPDQFHLPCNGVKLTKHFCYFQNILNKLTGFYMIMTLVVNILTILLKLINLLIFTEY